MKKLTVDFRNFAKATNNRETLMCNPRAKQIPYLLSRHEHNTGKYNIKIDLTGCKNVDLNCQGKDRKQG